MGWLERVDRWNQEQAERDNTRFDLVFDHDEDADAGPIEIAGWYGSGVGGLIAIAALAVAGIAGWVRRRRRA